MIFRKYLNCISRRAEGPGREILKRWPCSSICLSIHLSVRVHPSVCPSICLSVHPSVCLSIHLSVCPSSHFDFTWLPKKMHCCIFSKLCRYMYHVIGVCWIDFDIDGMLFEFFMKFSNIEKCPFTYYGVMGVMFSF